MHHSFKISSLKTLLNSINVYFKIHIMYTPVHDGDTVAPYCICPSCKTHIAGIKILSSLEGTPISSLRESLIFCPECNQALVIG
jgi:hypothetical protein